MQLCKFIISMCGKQLLQTTKSNEKEYTRIIIYLPLDFFWGGGCFITCHKIHKTLFQIITFENKRFFKHEITFDLSAEYLSKSKVKRLLI